MIRAHAAKPVGWYILRSAAIITVAAALAACGATNPPGTASATARPSIPAATTTAPASSADVARQQAISAYRGMWQDFVAAGATSDWRSPKLGEYATGVALTNLSRSLYADHYNGLVTRGEPILNPSVSSVDPDADPGKVVITDCGDSTHWLKYRADNGEPANDTPGGRSLINAIVEKQHDGSWKVSDYGVHEAGSC